MAKIKAQNFGFGDFLGARPPKGKKTCPGPMCTIKQNFTPIGATVSEIFVTEQRKKQQPV